MNVVELKQRPPLPSDFASELRALADRVDRGEVTGFVCGMVSCGAYEFLFPSSLSDSLLLATLLQHRCIERMKA